MKRRLVSLMSSSGKTARIYSTGHNESVRWMSLPVMDLLNSHFLVLSLMNHEKHLHSEG